MWHDIEGLRHMLRAEQGRTLADSCGTSADGYAIAISGAVRNHVSSAELAEWKRVAYFLGWHLVVASSDSLQLELSADEIASRTAFFERIRTFVAERERLWELRRNAFQARRVLTGEFARDWRPPSEEERRMITVVEAAYQDGLARAGHGGKWALSGKPLPASRFPRPEVPYCLASLTEAQRWQLITDAAAERGNDLNYGSEEVDSTSTMIGAEEPLPAYLLDRARAARFERNLIRIHGEPPPADWRRPPSPAPLPERSPPSSRDDGEAEPIIGDGEAPAEEARPGAGDAHAEGDAREMSESESEDDSPKVLGGEDEDELDDAVWSDTCAFSDSDDNDIDDLFGCDLAYVENQF